MSPEIYAQAIHQLHSEGKTSDEVVKGMKDSLTKRGALGLIPQILSAYEKIVAQAGNTKARLTVARQADADNALKEAGIPEAEANIIVDERIIGGYRVEKEGVLTDKSFKAQLLQVYRNATRA